MTCVRLIGGRVSRIGLLTMCAWVSVAALAAASTSPNKGYTNFGATHNGAHA